MGRIDMSEEKKQRLKEVSILVVCFAANIIMNKIVF